MPSPNLSLAAAALLLAVATPAGAHFPWLAADDQGRPILFFGENPADRDYTLPEAVENAEVVHLARDKATPVSLEVVDSEEFVGRRASAKAPAAGRLMSTMVYGVYHGSKLTYYAQHELALRKSKDESAAKTKQHAHGSAKKEGSAEKKKGHPRHALRAKLFSTPEGGVAVQVMWQHEPLASVPVQLFCDEGHVEGRGKTDDNGFVRFNSKQVEPGLNGVMVGHTVKGESGEQDGEAYTSASHYLTATFFANKSEGHAEDGSGSKKAGSGTKKSEGSGAKKNAKADAAPAVSADALPPLPEAVASFGAAATDGWLYVYSGHVGRAHAHSRDNLAKRFVRAKLDGSGDWEELPMGPPLQGLAMAPHGGKIYRIGGLDARNPAGEEDDLHSIDSFACYDPATNKWTDMTPLPSGRSSHNAVVMGDTLYVVGGWRLEGENSGDWHENALAFDLKNPAAGWKELPKPPFLRRALAVGHAGGRLVAIGGMTDEGDISPGSYVFDPKANKWSEGPALPGGRFQGFGLAAWNAGGALYTGGMDGVLYRLADDQSAWQPAGKFSMNRFFHQMVPDGKGGLLAVAGASPQVGHTGTIERLEL